jgi:hypothetical protein
MWDITDHVCRRCLGRLLEREEAGRKIYRCADCGASGEGHVSDLCTCGVTLKTGKRVSFQCVPNRAKSDAYSAEIVSAFGPVDADKPRRQSSRQINLELPDG